MKILANLGTLKNGCTALVIEDAYHPNYAIVSGFDDSKPIGEKWNAATYFDGNLKAFMDEVQRIEYGIGYDRAIEVIRDTFSNIAEEAEDPCILKENLEAVMDEDEIEACGFDLQGLINEVEGINDDDVIEDDE